MNKKMDQTASSPATSACEHSKLIEEINRVYELMSTLRAIVLPLSPKDRSSEIVRGLFEEIFGSFTTVLSKLQASSRSKDGDPNEWDENRKRMKLDTWTILTTIPLNDGHQWRKYGQKKINGLKFPRSYYRCFHHVEQGCSATKTVQQKEGKGYPPKFEVTYNMQHTCQIAGTCSIESSRKGALNNKRNLEDPFVKLANKSDITSVGRVDFGEVLPNEPHVYMPPMEDLVPDIFSPWEISMDEIWSTIEENA